MSDTQESMSDASMCEIIGCSSPATTTRWSIDDERQLHVCWKHADEDSGSDESDA